jgi:RNA polymerase sigma factor (sigma-70 family)
MRQTQWNVSPEETPVALLYQRHAQTILAYIRPRVPSKEDAEDILLDVFLRAMQHETPFHLSEDQQQIWLRHVARNQIIDRYRQQGRVPAHSSLDALAETLCADEGEGPEAQILRQTLSDELLELLADLSPVQQTVLHLRFARDLSTREIAQQLQKSDGSIRTLLSRTLNHLRGVYERRKGGV